jgi:hypothetical protein
MDIQELKKALANLPFAERQQLLAEFQSIKKSYAGLSNIEQLKLFCEQELLYTGFTDELGEKITKFEKSGKMIRPVLFNCGEVHKRIIDITGEAYNHPKDNGYTIDQALPHLYIENPQLQFIKVNDSTEPDTHLRMSYSAFIKKHFSKQVVNIRQYMAVYLYDLIVLNRKLDSGPTRTITLDRYSCSDRITYGSTFGDKFCLGHDKCGNDNGLGGFRVVSAMLEI